LCYRKSFWQRHPFPDISVAEDARFIWQAEPDKVLALDDDRFIVAYLHSGNISPKLTSAPYWQPAAADDARRLMDGAKALVAASRGIGDILRVTPLIRAFHRLGYEVDVFLEPDYADAVQLLDGAPEVHRVHTKPPAETYDLAAFTAWSASRQPAVSARRKIAFDRNRWLAEGDSRAIERIAREAGWQGAMPEPFAVAGDRSFDLPPGTIALHTGCKPDWPWKKWHGFDELAGLLPNVVLVGTASDLRNEGTYFNREFRWPPHVRNYVGQLSLRDTAALIRQCAALVSNDSGMMHLGAALRVPTLGVFGITSPDREAMPSASMFPITKGLGCEPGCRAGPWGRRDCEHHLECLRSLSATEVMERLAAIVGPKGTAPKRKTEVPGMGKVSVVYHGHIFDSSGYGNAARAYVHALHNAGVELSVADLSRHERQVRDELVESLVGRDLIPDFHVFHGIPHVWAQQAFRLPNAIAMTVWETDTMPTQWRNTLNHVLEVWLPCEYNVTAFRNQIARPLVKLPHAVPHRNGEYRTPEPRQFLGVQDDQFVVYSIFEWQDRKCPVEQIECYLEAFQGDEGTVLILKTNPAAETVARRALEEARARSHSRARIDLHCEAWDEGGIAALHQRGDCYLSLHRGEGWCYPLFEAACRGTPVVATAYSGPLEYLDGGGHQLVNYRLTSVRQPYIYYHPRMHWAEPDMADAAAKLRYVFDHREIARQSAQQAAGDLRQRFSMDEIGRQAKARLLELLQRTNPSRWQQIQSANRAARPEPPRPIPGSWFDEDYFEFGIKSNWDRGYQWSVFQGLFRDTAAFLTDVFPDKWSYLDAGCAKGFLVKALREKHLDARGFDVSPWAVEHAEPDVRAHLTLAGVDDFAPASGCDILLAFHLLAHLTEDQIKRFLTRARAWTHIGILAVIPLWDEPAEHPNGDRDLSHITRRPRAWWHEQFLAAGWRQDGLHKLVEQSCQRHALPSRMGWQIFLYSPS
jgi:ADP-heptose:LPS heptosyltransferase/glycosyltransferase involved in cell wall biosynthesis